MKKNTFHSGIFLYSLLLVFILSLAYASGAEIYSLLATKNIPSLGVYNLQFFKTSTRENPELKMGYNYLTDFKFDQAIKELNNCIQKNPQNPILQSEAYAYIGYCYLNLRKKDLAIENLEQAIRHNGKNELAYFFLANEYFLDGENKKVKEYLLKTVELFPNFIAPLRMLAEIYKDEGELELSIKYYAKLVEILPNSGYYRLQLYRAYNLQNNYGKAEEQVLAMMKLEPNFILNYYRLGDVYVKQKKYDKALKAFDKLMEDRHNEYRAHLGRAQTFLAMGKLNDAKMEAKKAVTMSPDNMEVISVIKQIEWKEDEKRSKVINISLVIGIIILLLGSISFYIFTTYRRSFFLAVISEFNEKVDEIYDIGELAHYILEFFSRIFDVAKSYLFFYNRQNNTLSMMISHGTREEESEGFRIVTGNEVTNWIIQEQRPTINIRDIERSKLFEEAFPSLAERLKKKLINHLITLKEKNSLIGFIALEGNKEDDRLKPVHYDLLYPLVNIASQSLQTLFLFESSIIDELTGLYNKRYFYQSLSIELKRADRYQQPCSLCTLDIDDFKRLNDTFGHDQGDLVLAEFGRILRQSIRDGIDVAARTGGEEFFLILPATNTESACVVAERVRQAMEEHVFKGFDKPVKITVSIGIATYPNNAQNEQELIKAADGALYLSKRTGKNKYSRADELNEGIGKFGKTFSGEPILEERFDHLNIKDDNTGLFNFSYFSFRIKEEIKRANRYKFPCSLLILKFNFNFSDESKKTVHQLVATVIKSGLREGIDTPAIIGDDLLAIIVPETPRENAGILAKRLIQTIEKKDITVGDGKISISTGISSYPECSESETQLMETATNTVQKAQQMGENKILIAPSILMEVQ